MPHALPAPTFSICMGHAGWCRFASCVSLRDCMLRRPDYCSACNGKVMGGDRSPDRRRGRGIQRYPSRPRLTSIAVGGWRRESVKCPSILGSHIRGEGNALGKEACRADSLPPHLVVVGCGRRQTGFFCDRQLRFCSDVHGPATRCDPFLIAEIYAGRSSRDQCKGVCYIASQGKPHVCARHGVH